MIWNTINEEALLHWINCVWLALAAVWLVMWFGMKRAKRIETPGEMLQHALPAMLGFWLLFENGWKWLNEKFPPASTTVWLTGLLLTVVGIGISIWARLTLGANWSGVVTLKKDHELIRSGLYRWIRHPIYTGILLAVIGTALARGHLRGWLGFAVLGGNFFFKARREEQFLRQEFGAGFDEHVRQTGMFLPKFT